MRARERALNRKKSDEPQRIGQAAPDVGRSASSDPGWLTRGSRGIR